MRWFWGFLLLLVGAVILGKNLSWWSGVEISYLWHFWPLLLIILGLYLLARHWRYGWLVMIFITTFSLGLAVYVLTSKNFPDSVANQQIKSVSFEESLEENTKSAEIFIEAGAVTIDINNTDDDKLFRGTLESDYSTLEKEQSINGDKVVAKITVKSDYSGILDNKRNHLNIYLNDKIPLKLTIKTGASSMKINLEKNKISGINIESGAILLDMAIGEQVENNALINVKSGASTIDISLPENLGAKAYVEAGPNEKNFNGFEKIDGRNYRTSNYIEAAKRLSLNIQAGLSSININRTTEEE